MPVSMPTATPLPISDLLCRPVEFKFGGRAWGLLLTYGVLLQCEWVTGLDMIGSGKNILNPNAAGLRALLWALLSRDGCEWTQVEIGRRLTPKLVIAAKEAIQKAYTESMPEPEPEKEPERGRDGKPLPKPVHDPLSWLDTWGLARIQLRLTDAEFQAITPRMLHALRKAEIHEKQWLEIQLSRLTAYLINFSQCHPKEPVEDDAFMLHKFDTEPEDIGDQIMRAMGGIRQRLEQVKGAHGGVLPSAPGSMVIPSDTLI